MTTATFSAKICKTGLVCELVEAALVLALTISVPVCMFFGLN